MSVDSFTVTGQHQGEELTKTRPGEMLDSPASV